MSKSNRCLYNNNFQEFCAEDSNSILGHIVDSYHGDIPTTSRDAWKEEIEILKNLLEPYKNEEGQIIFEYEIPRLGKRIDVVLLFRGIIFCIEFKTGESEVTDGAIDQVLDYALDLDNFHEYSEGKIIVPLLVVTKYNDFTKEIKKDNESRSNVIGALITGERYFKKQIDMVLEKWTDETPINSKWIISPYSPTPTIIEATKKLYEEHSVKDIKTHGTDTDKTIEYIQKVIEKSKANRKKSICFVTGVPGAGKTLVGLEVAIKQTYQGNKEPVKDEGAVYLSGNGPLVAVLTEALARDNVERNSGIGKQKRLDDARREVSRSIQMIHRYRDNMLKKIKNPVENNTLEIDPKKAVQHGEAGYGEVEHVAIFDEAQRTWTQERLANYLKRGGTYGNKIKVPNFPLSEAEFLIWSLDQREDWATIVCLVGGGQEINTGEAGISDWIKALNEKFTHWDIYISDKLTDKEYADGKTNELLKNNKKVTYADELHLSKTLRSFKAKNVSRFVNCLLNIDSNNFGLYKDIKTKYPLFLTRDMEKAKSWIHKHTRGNERSGILISKESARYKPMAVHLCGDKDKDIIHWFLDGKKDTRSSNYLEDAVTEIQVQGLELDYACLLWDADFRYENGEWKYYRFNKGGQSWVNQTGKSKNSRDRIRYMLNAYRVLLTRARKGMIICVPFGNGNKDLDGKDEDATRLPQFYDGTYEYLKSVGIDEI